MIEFNQVSLQRGIKPLLEKADLRIHDGQKLALIGANGAGKSSLFALLLGELSIDQGDLYFPANWRIAHMAQEVDASERSAIDYVIDGDKEYRAIEHGINTATCDNELADWYGKMDAHGGYTINVQAEQLLHGLGFSQSDMDSPVSGFSGGWRIRLNLAQALMTPSDLLLLDEPTNHLDLDATLWLEQWLNKYQGTLLFISHDRDFIDGVADHIVHLHQCELTSYPGNYSAYERIRAERLAQQQVMHEKQKVRIAEIEKFVTRFKAKASKAKQAQSRVKELERMELIAPAHVDSPFQFEFPCHEKFSTPLLNIEDADIGYQSNDGDTKILFKQNVSLVPGHRIGLLGANGAGKSTLIKTLCEELPMLSGQRHEGEHLKLGYYAQHQLESLDVNASPLLMIQRISPQASEQEIRNFLGGFDFRGDKALDICEPFSGGEKARLALALVAWQKPNLLVMDEPTNHLDIEMREALTMALQNFPGAIVVVSHDRHLLKATVDEYWLVEDGKIANFDGDLHDYHKHVQAKQAGANSAAGTGQLASNPNSVVNNPEPVIDNPNAGLSAQEKKEQKRLAAERRQNLAPKRKELKKLESKMEKLQSKLDEIENQLADTALYEADRKNDLQALLQQQVDLKNELEKVEMVWMELSEELEAAE